MNTFFQTGDWKAEKHVPSIVLSQKNGSHLISISVGEEIPHPNTSSHHIAWIEVYFHPEMGKYPILLGHFDFSAHGASIEGPDTSGIYTSPLASCLFRTAKSGTVHATSYCNIHGLWTNAVELKI